MQAKPPVLWTCCCKAFVDKTLQSKTNLFGVSESIVEQIYRRADACARQTPLIEMMCFVSSNLRSIFKVTHA